MPINARLLPAHGLIHARYHGRILRSDIGAALLPLYRTDGYVPGLPEIHDLRDITSIEITFAEMMDHAQDVAGTFKWMACPADLHFLAPHDVGFGMARMFQTLITTSDPSAQITVTRDEAEILARLNLRADTLNEVLFA